MVQTDPQMFPTRPVIRQLDEATINRIAAGEVVERPASAVKELVENALDAGAHRIEIVYSGGGKSLIRVTDDGCGIAAGDLELALSRHATSKIDGTDLLAIRSFGFRGEALPSLGAVGRLTITSRIPGEAAAQITVRGGTLAPVRPAALSGGTVVELRDLFYATPARLKFLRTDRAEAQAIADMVKRLAMAEPFVTFILRDASDGEDRTVFRADAETGEAFVALHGRLGTVLGRDFAANALRLEAMRDGFHLTGYAALPTYSRGAAVAQHVFVNGRPVRDKLLMGALKGAYSDVLSRDRHPAAAIFVDCDPHLVDVNVHPAKAEVRFRDPTAVRGLIVSGIRQAISGAGHRASSTVGTAALAAFRPETARVYQMDRFARGARLSTPVTQPPALSGLAEPSARFAGSEAPPELVRLPLGAAVAQIHENYIVAQTAGGMILVDQHAAHERLVYERLKRQMEAHGVASQALLIPEIVDLPEADALRLLELAPELARFGLVIEPFGRGAIAVREIPALMGQVSAGTMLADILDELGDLGTSAALQTRTHAILSRVACHGAIRSGRRMLPAEMNALLRDMEATPGSGQCNHGRPTYVELKLSDLERLFGRH